MSEKIHCAHCGMLLYFGEEIARRLYLRAIPDEAAVLAMYEGACPRCASALTADTVTVEVERRQRPHVA